MKRAVQLVAVLVLFGASGCSVLPKAAVRMRVLHFNTQKSEEMAAYYPEASLPFGGPKDVKEAPLALAAVPTGVLEALLDKVFSLVGRIEILTFEKGVEPPTKEEK